MQYIELGDARIPALGYGTWQLEGDACTAGVHHALELGYRHIDTAQIYGNEAQVGAALAKTHVERKDIWLTTKVWTDRLSKGDLEKSVDESLTKLQTDYVDLLLIHWPSKDVFLSDTIDALKHVMAEGKTRHIGVSNFPVKLMAEAQRLSGGKMITNQVEYHPFLDQTPVLDYVRNHNMFLTAYSPLARGRVNQDATLIDLGNKYGKTPAQITLRWLVQQPGVCAIPKAANPEHIKTNMQIFDFSLTDAEMSEIGKLRGDLRLVNPAFAPVWDAAAAGCKV